VNQFAEVVDKVLLGAEVALTEIFEVSVIELLELQAIILKTKCFGLESEHPMAKLYIAEMAAEQNKWKPLMRSTFAGTSLA
jgi:hypothetical protein